MKYQFNYTDGTIRIKEFRYKQEMIEFARMEGDHLLDYFPVLEYPKGIKDNTEIKYK